MVALSRCLGSVALFLAGADGARRSRHRKEAPSTKFIAGVPVLNYHTAYGGKASLGQVATEEEQEWVVMVKPGTSDAKLQSMCKVNRNGCNYVGHPTGGVPFIEMRGTEQDLEAVLKVSDGAAKYVEPDAEVHEIPEIEADGVEAATWGLNRIGADQRGRAGAGATVFILDTGVRVSHQDFSGRAFPSLDVTVGDPVECNGDLSCAGDRRGHGTHCAGTAAGVTFGVAPSAAIGGVKVLNDQGSGTYAGIYYGIDWLTANPTRPAVGSMSLGGSGTQQAMADAVNAAVNSGVVIVVAGGNSNSDACGFTPAFVPSAITVGSTTSTDARSSFSNYGSCTNIWAPGSNVVSASHTSDTGSSTKSGTSMACPHVSGAAALVLEADPSKKASAVLQDLIDTSYRNALSGLKASDINALLCVAEGGAPPTPTPEPTPAPAPGSWVISGSGCSLAGDCIQSNNHPSNYGNSEECSIQLYGDIAISVAAFNTESRYDYLTMGGTSYSGTSGPPSGTYSGAIQWSSDSSVVRSGWKLCRA